MTSVMLLLGASLVGCGDPLAVDDPTAILESEVNTAEGAELLRRGALARFFLAVPEQAWFGGLLADEFRLQQNAFFDNQPFPSFDEQIDRRTSEADLIVASGGPGQVRAPGGYFHLQRVRGHLAAVALETLRAHGRPGAREAHVGEMLAVRGYTAMRLAEDYCPGYPLHEVENFTQVFSPPMSTQATFDYALAAFDSALVWAADSARVLNFARVGRARTLLDLGRFAEAAAAVAGVPTEYVYRAEYLAISVDNSLASQLGFRGWGTQRSVTDREGGNGLDFVSAQDPRVVTVRLGTGRSGVMYGIGKYPNRTASFVVASGIEARLVEAEVQLQTNPGSGTWLSILNSLRTAVPGLQPLQDPGTPAARLDLVYRERAFWLFATGTRLADLRRLVKVYGRASASVFPSGTYWRGGAFGSGTSLLFPTFETERGAPQCLSE